MKHEYIKEQWQSFILCQSTQKNSKHPNINLADIKNFFLKEKIVQFDKIEDLTQKRSISHQEESLLRSFLERLKSDRLSCDLVSHSLTHNKSMLFIDFESEVFTSKWSYQPVNGQSCLNFISESHSKESVIILQHVSTCDAVFIPKFNAIFRSGHLTLDNSIGNIQKQFLAYINGEFNFSDNSFGGISASHGRPYHYYYDVALALRMLYKEKLLQEIPMHYQACGGDFLRIDKIFNLKTPNKYKLISHHESNKKSREEEKYFIQVGLLYKHDRHKNLMKGLDANIRAAVKREKNDTGDIGFSLRGNFPIVWIGVTGQKRCWLEQIPAQALFINKLHEIYPGLTIVFDGWTSPMRPSSADSKAIIEDNNIATQLKDQLTNDITTHSVIGANTVVKLKVAMQCHFFVANQGTGSMHICRMAQVKGITHISNAFFNTSLKQHQLETAIIFPQALINDTPDPENPRMDFVDYSISPKDFIEFSLPTAVAYLNSITD